MKRIAEIILAIATLLCWGCAKNDGEDSFDDLAIYYTVTFVQDGVEMKSVSVERGKAVDESLIPQITAERTGYTAEWEDVNLSSVKSDLTVNVVFIPNVYQILYYLDKGGELYLTQDVTYGAEFSLVNGPTATGKSFIRWEFVSKGESLPDGTWTKDGDLELFAVWEIWSPLG